MTTMQSFVFTVALFTMLLLLSLPHRTQSQTMSPTYAPPAYHQNGECGKLITNNGKEGSSVMTTTGFQGRGYRTFQYDAHSVPNRFRLVYNDEEVINTGFRGNSSYNAELKALGYPPVAGPGNGSTTFFLKAAYSYTIEVFVDSPLSGINWAFFVEC